MTGKDWFIFGYAIFVGLNAAFTLFVVLNRWVIPRGWWDGARNKDQSRWMRFRHGLYNRGWEPFWVMCFLVAMLVMVPVIGAYGPSGGD
jgi:hypothetical protein